MTDWEGDQLNLLKNTRHLRRNNHQYSSYLLLSCSSCVAAEESESVTCLHKEKKYWPWFMNPFFLHIENDKNKSKLYKNTHHYLPELVHQVYRSSLKIMHQSKTFKGMYKSTNPSFIKVVWQYDGYVLCIMNMLTLFLSQGLIRPMPLFLAFNLI